MGQSGLIVAPPYMASPVTADRERLPLPIKLSHNGSLSQAPHYHPITPHHDPQHLHAIGAAPTVAEVNFISTLFHAPSPPRPALPENYVTHIDGITGESALINS
ncbi:acyl-CoA synthetase [Ceratobasidium sp. AG-Ba]|nr:acyl-CoA synthetase [Ceratobasidium sp. AG-Ba]